MKIYNSKYKLPKKILQNHFYYSGTQCIINKNNKNKLVFKKIT